MSIKRCMALVFTLTILLGSFGFGTPASAAKKETPASLQESLFGDTLPKLDDGSKAHYDLDITTVPEKDDGGNVVTDAFESAKELVTGKSIVDGYNNYVAENKNSMANTIFQANLFFESALLKGLDIAFNFEIINKLIDALDGPMRALTGINSSGFTNDGLVGSVLPIATSLSALIAVFLIAWKRQTISGFKTLGGTVIVASCALLFFVQFSPFLKGANELSNGFSAMVITGPAKAMASGAKTSEQVQQEMYKNIHSQFIHRPYLFMMYGTDDESKIGKKRIDKLLKMAPGEKRVKYVEDVEVKEKNNLNMTYANVNDRLTFSLYYSFLNFINGLVIAFIILAFIALQFWYIGIAAVAGIVFMWAVFPNQFAILQNFSYRLLEPLGIKVLLSLFTFVFFTVSTLVYKLNITSVGGYFEASLVQLGIYTLIFFFRKKIKAIFSKNKQFNYMIHELKNIRQAAIRPVMATAQVAATAVGGYMAGPQGAIAGYKAVDAIKEKGIAGIDLPRREKPSLASLPEEATKPEIIDWRDNAENEKPATTSLYDQNDAQQETKQEPTNQVEPKERFKLIPLSKSSENQKEGDNE